MNFERIRQVSRQAEELRARLQEPEIWQDPALFSRCQKELQELAPLADAYARWEAAGRELEGLEDATVFFDTRDRILPRLLYILAKFDQLVQIMRYCFLFELVVHFRDNFG